MSQLIKQSHASTGVPLWTPAGSGTPPFVAEYPDIWAGSPPTTTDDAINRLSMLLYGRTALNGKLAELTPMSKIIVNSGNQEGGTDAYVVKYRPTGEADWFARLGGGVGSDIGRAVDVDSAGNVIACGSYGTNPLVVFNADGSTFGTLPADSSFVVKYNASGVVQWATRMGGTPSRISVDASGNTLVGLTYGNNPLTIFNANGTTFGTLANSGGNDVGIVKINPTGTVQWATRCGSAGNDSVRGISADSTGNVYVCGDYTGTLTLFNSDTTTFTTLAGLGGADNFVVKYSPAGMGIWATRMGGTDNTDNLNECKALANGDVYIGGRTGQNAYNIYNSDGTLARTITGTGGFDGFIIKFNSLGFFQWIGRMTGTIAERITDLGADDTGSVYGVGDFGSGGTCVIVNADGSTFATLVSMGGFDAYVVKYNVDGVVQWVSQLTSLGDELNPICAVDGAGNVSVGLQTSANGLVAFNSNKTLFNTYTNLGGGFDTYVIRYNTNGFGVWSAGISGTGADDISRVRANSTGVVATGSYASIPVFIRSAGL